ncbi:tRNA (adenosine(37)-N6)-threonylcarbamoyltransferase complex dimerization subunit type 1 TsaB [Candidatus Magnetaquicoccus inordinatus]|uniref:tRNA (adenosine(37)-N6)-threonylcarbamoyltransferase complex dimerization subunit type 1 TsaB n=1 Tax=Candidatus Magnetaquicoccus inordinatus TaxID=2496818 RepID=UPI00187D2777|nr:tRNA (adenosine(37)-N6)-threonylcarbamoyltransferase complex dimerization subunit type 1 TsaB [Candidatus Magnetaquicoccus inordinatus]
MLTLAVDTASAQGGIALLDGDVSLACRFFQGPAGHAVLLPQICQQLLQEVGWQPKDLQLLAINNGPGAFAGLRIGAAFAQGFSLAHAIPIVGISTLDLLAAQCPCTSNWISVLVDARRQEIFAALYQRQESGLQLLHAPGAALSPSAWISTLEQWPWPAASQLLLTGNALQAYPELLAHTWPLPSQCTPASQWIIDPALLGRLAQQQWQALPEPKALLTPLLDYQRRPDADPPVALLRPQQ